MRILNADVLTSHGNGAGRRAVVEILEAGMQAADPYTNTRRLLRVDGNRLVVGNRAFEPCGGPKAGQDEVFDLSAELRRHDTTPALWKLGDGVVATHGVSMTDLDVILVLSE